VQDAPQPLRDAYAAWRWSIAWTSGPGKRVYRLDGADGVTRFLKLQPAGQQITLAMEAERLRWAGAFCAVPRVEGEGVDDGTEWLLTSGLPGRDATDPDLRADPRSVAAALGRGLWRLHETLPVSECPFDSRLDVLLAQVQARAAAGLINHDEDFHPEHQQLSVAEAVELLQGERPVTEDLVVCHGDYCFPNALIEDGEVTGYLDLGELGVADRWWDIAVGAWSTTWNVGPGYEGAFYAAYGIAPDAERIRYYRLLYDLVS
jgi:kanamycin kinase